MQIFYSNECFREKKVRNLGQVRQILQEKNLITDIIIRKKEKREEYFAGYC